MPIRRGPLANLSWLVTPDAACCSDDVHCMYHSALIHAELIASQRRRIWIWGGKEWVLEGKCWRRSGERSKQRGGPTHFKHWGRPSRTAKLWTTHKTY